MHFKDVDYWIIKHYRQRYNNWGSSPIMSELCNGRPWCRGGVQKIIEKIDEIDSTDRRLGRQLIHSSSMSRLALMPTEAISSIC